MNPFVYHNPTRLIFGKGQLKQLPQEVRKYGTNVLLVYGGGSIKRSGLYDKVTALLKEAGATVHEMGGVEPNPRLTTVHEGARLCREHNIDFLLAVGGGSTIDAVKAIAASAKYDGSFWDIVTRQAAVEEALPFGTVLTLAATGSEMNSGSVITNWETNEKRGWGSPHVFPRFSILDPENTYTVPKDQTVYGMVDIMSHVFEQYFHQEQNSPVQDGFAESILRAMIDTAPKLINDLQNYELRETVLYSGTMALNGTLAMGVTGDWATHGIEHAVSAIYDIPHGGGLAILFPNWMKHTLEENLPRYRNFAVRVFGIQAEGRDDREVALEGIEALRAFWTSIGAPSRLADYDIDGSRIEEMAEKAIDQGVSGTLGQLKKLTKEDVMEIYRMSL
ncbi:iron-containing alcohol dehydrogenase [Paenibacillus aurantius]|uniref:Iron-containing alcohol dehydrogenase n=1 Tax=Paenibacillus aurantius TaxID=2918900 RepID=A0AA96LGN0_9BACL|nr:iron-containing alcohol dehydrogenase [Paenibacillus aurantius]WNQ11147.1 iron-containing alcohol dehydrogenase [Paenibacillus aurantius]